MGKTMKKTLALILAFLTLAPPALALPGRIQNEDVKSLSDLQSSVATITGNLTSGNACITSPSSIAKLAAGQFIYDSTTAANIPSGTTITAIPGTCSAGQIQMSANAAGTATGDTITFGGQMSQLINDTKIYVSANSINTQLSTAITNGVIGGGGGGGVQLLSNPSFEIGTNGNPPSSWNITTGTGSLSTSVFYAGTQAEIVTASSQTSSIAQDVTPTQAYSAVNMEASCKVKTSLTNVQVCARTGGSDLTGCTPVPSTNTWQYVPMNFIGPASGSIGVDVKMTSSGSGSFSVDDCYVGPARNLSQVSQTQLLGGVVVSCSGAWSLTSASFAVFPAASGCTYTPFGQAQAPATSVPGIKFATMPPGEYIIQYEGEFQNTVGGQQAAIQFWDGTNVTREQSWCGNQTIICPGVFQTFNYTTAQSNVTWQARGLTGVSGGVNLRPDVGPQVIKVYYTPSQSQIALNSNLGPVAFYAANQTPTGTVGAAVNIAKFGTVTKDTYGAYSTSTGLYTIPVEGWYHADGKLAYSQTSINNQDAGAIIEVNGVSVAATNVTSTTAVTSAQPTVSITFYAKIGDTVGLYSFNNNTGPSYAGTGIGDNSYFSIVQTNGASNSPILVGSVTSNSSSSERMERVNVATGCNSSPCTITSQSGSWLTSITRSSAGTYTLNFAAGEFSAAPSCTCASAGAITDTWCEYLNGTATSSSATINTRAAGGSLGDTSFSVLCQGPH